MKQWLQTEWDYASWSESTMESAIMGTVRNAWSSWSRTWPPASIASFCALPL
jgi:hypothetical protein